MKFHECIDGEILDSLEIFQGRGEDVLVWGVEKAPEGAAEDGKGGREIEAGTVEEDEMAVNGRVLEDLGSKITKTVCSFVLWR